MKKPTAKYSNSKKWKLYTVSIYLQIWAFFLTLFTGREITHVFFFSEKQKETIKKFSALPYTSSSISYRYINLFKNKEYTQMMGLECGWSNWNDAKLLGFGSDKDTKTKHR